MLNPLQDLIQMMTAKAVQEFLSSEFPKLYILGGCILSLFWTSILFNENNLSTCKAHRVQDSLSDEFNFLHW